MIVPYNTQNASIIKAAILSGKVVSFPTDTLFALACDATSDKAIEHLFSIKKRETKKTAPILVANLEQATQYAEFNEKALELANKFWPGALTLILPSLPQNPLSRLAIRNNTIGLRIPNHPVALAILKDAQAPLLGTSANIANTTNLNSANAIEKVFGSELAMVVNGSKKPNGAASTIAKIDSHGIAILRQGAVIIDHQI
jgi:L-threonylcarbamoyladenylate synthase